MTKRQEVDAAIQRWMGKIANTGKYVVKYGVDGRIQSLHAAVPSEKRRAMINWAKEEHTS